MVLPLTPITIYVFRTITGNMTFVEAKEAKSVDTDNREFVFVTLADEDVTTI